MGAAGKAFKAFGKQKVTCGKRSLFFPSSLLIFAPRKPLFLLFMMGVSATFRPPDGYLSSPWRLPFVPLTATFRPPQLVSGVPHCVEMATVYRVQVALEGFMKKTLTISPSRGEMLKPAELIELRGVGPLSLHDRRVFNGLVEAAWGPQMAEPGRKFTISTASLLFGDEPMTRLIDSIERLMQTIVVARTAEGEETRLQLLGTNTIKKGPNRGTLTYSFPPDLAELIKDSSIFAKLDLAVMQSFGSKYAFALYEAVARRVRMKHVFYETLSIEGIRDLLGVEDGKLVPYKNLQAKAIDPALTEVNALTPFTVSIESRREGRKVMGFTLGWQVKDEAGMQEAYAEMNRPRIGRRERLTQAAERVISD